jgi:cytochrome bd-type quinol oxidase subunit 2
MFEPLDALILARAQFAFTVMFHIIFPAFSIGLASYLMVLEGMWLKTNKTVYLNLFKYWRKIFAVAFGMGVVSGIVMSYQFGTNWSVFSDKAGPVIGPLMGIVSLWTPFLSPEIAERWFTFPHLLFVMPVPTLTAILAALLGWSLLKKKDQIPFPTAIGLFALCFAGLGIGIAPYIVPRAITIHEAAAPDASLSFMLVGAAVLLPLIIAYTAYSYWVFRGKVDPEAGYH